MRVHTRCTHRQARTYFSRRRGTQPGHKRARAAPSLPTLRLECMRRTLRRLSCHRKTAAQRTRRFQKPVQPARAARNAEHSWKQDAADRFDAGLVACQHLSTMSPDQRPPTVVPLVPPGLDKALRSTALTDSVARLLLQPADAPVVQQRLQRCSVMIYVEARVKRGFGGINDTARFRMVSVGERC
jgi:hypothetical protein